MTYQLVWIAWAALVFLTLALAYAVARWRSRPAERALSFILGAVFAQVLTLFAVGVPRFLVTAYTTGAGEGACRIGFVVAYAVGTIAVGAAGVLCARNPLIRPSWWFIAGAVSMNAYAAAGILVSWGQQTVESAVTSLVLNVVLASALALGYWWGLRPSRASLRAARSLAGNRPTAPTRP